MQKGEVNLKNPTQDVFLHQSLDGAATIQQKSVVLLNKYTNNYSKEETTIKNGLRERQSQGKLLTKNSKIQHQIIHNGDMYVRRMHTVVRAADHQTNPKHGDSDS